jgi:hypothetical protein
MLAIISSTGTREMQKHAKKQTKEGGDKKKTEYNVVKKIAE